MDQALRLAKKTAKEHSVEEAKRIYQDILVKFPKNKRAMDGLKGLAGERVSEVSQGSRSTTRSTAIIGRSLQRGTLQEALEQATIVAAVS